MQELWREDGMHCGWTYLMSGQGPCGRLHPEYYPDSRLYSGYYPEFLSVMCTVKIGRGSAIANARFQGNICFRVSRNVCT